VYDGLGKRRKVTEKSSGQVVASSCYLWCDYELCEKRDVTGANVEERYFASGFQSLTGAFVGIAFYARDHLGNVRNILDAAGSVRQTVSYDPWGAAIPEQATFPAPFTFTGHWSHNLSGLILSPTRAYSPWGGRWISRDWFDDPLDNPDGPNVYTYGANDPVNRVDSIGAASALSLMTNLRCPPPRTIFGINPPRTIFRIKGGNKTVGGVRG